jgi:hypothetical protein
MGKKIKIPIWDEHPGSYLRELRNNFLKFFDVDPDPGSGIFLSRNPGWKSLDPGSRINIPDPQHWLNGTRSTVYRVFVFSEVFG